MTRKPHAGRWLLAIVVILLITAGGVWAYVSYGLTLPKFDFRQGAAITITTVIVAGKMTLKGILGKEFKLHEQGPETTLMALAVALPTTAEYFIVRSPHAWKWSGFSVAAIIITFFAVLCSQAAEESAAGSKTNAGWSVASMCLGAGSFMFYMFMVVLKTG